MSCYCKNLHERTPFPVQVMKFETIVMRERDHPVALLCPTLFFNMILKLPGLLLTYYAVIVKYKQVIQKLPLEILIPMILMKFK